LVENKRSRFQARRPVKSEYTEFFDDIARVRARLTRGRVILSPVSVSVHGGPYSLRSEAFLGRSFSTRAAISSGLPIIEEYKGAFPRSRALSGRRRGSLG